MSITPGKVTEARRLLGWWQSDLAAKVGASVKTIRDFESGELVATPLVLGRVRHVFESAGVEFIAENGAPA